MAQLRLRTGIPVEPVALLDAPPTMARKRRKAAARRVEADKILASAGAMITVKQDYCETDGKTRRERQKSSPKGQR
eukprot:135862-Amphidinium_carterae.1